MSKELAERIRKQREFPVTIGKFTFTVRRPTAAEFQDFAIRGSTFKDIASEHVIGWSGVTEDDIVGGGGSDVVKFHVNLWREWCADREYLWDDIAERAIESYKAHKESLGVAEKN